MAVNSSTDTVFVIDSSSDRLAHAISVGKQPYEVSFTNALAYVRSLGTQDVGLIPDVGARRHGDAARHVHPRRPEATRRCRRHQYRRQHRAGCQAGGGCIYRQPGGRYRELLHGRHGCADGQLPQLRSRDACHHDRRSQPGRGVAGRLPRPRQDTGGGNLRHRIHDGFAAVPALLHCEGRAERSVQGRWRGQAGVELRQWRIAIITVGEPRTIRFRLEDTGTGTPAANIPDVSVLYYRSDGRGRKVQPAKSVGDGVYEAIVEATKPATYYVFVGAPSQDLEYSDSRSLA